MKPLSHENSTVSGSAIQKAAMFINEHSELAKRLIEELPTKNMFTSSEDAFIDVKFATADELQAILMRVFKGRLVVHTEAVAVDARPQVEATAMVMTEDGMIPMARSLAGVQLSHEFIMGQKAFLSAETRAIRKVLNHLGLLPEDEAEDPVLAKVKATPSKANAAPEYLEPHKDPEQYDLGDVVAQDNENEKPEPKKARSSDDDKASAEKKPAAEKPKRERVRKPAGKKAHANTEEVVSIPDDPLNITIPKDDSAWPDITAVTYIDTLNKGVEKAFKDRKAKQTDYSLEKFIRGVLGKDAQSSYSRLSLKRLRVTELEKLYAYYIHNCRPVSEEK